MLLRLLRAFSFLSFPFFYFFLSTQINFTMVWAKYLPKVIFKRIFDIAVCHVFYKSVLTVSLNNFVLMERQFGFFFPLKHFSVETTHCRRFSSQSRDFGRVRG